MPQQTLTLKQRLSNLALQTSAPSPPHSATGSLAPRPRSSSFGVGLGPPPAQGGAFPGAGRRKSFFNAPWSKLAPGGGSSSGTGRIAIDGLEETRRVEEVLAQMIFQAGVDYETRPMVVMNASAFPDPRDVSYDLLLTRILAYLDLFVESDYTVVFFAAGGHHAPNWNWVWKAYRSLSRKYRKNLKRLYIVHSSFFSKMLFSLAGAIISPKFFRKITYIDTLSTLAYHVPLTQIDIPPAVYKENLKHESQINLPTPSRSHMFGVSLEELMGYDGEKDGLPRVVRDCIQYLRDAGLEEQGLFRRSPNSALLRQVRDAYNRGQQVSLHSFDDPHLAAVLLKKFLRDLPVPLFPEHLYSTIQRCPTPADAPADMAAVLYIRETILPELPPCSYIVLSSVLNLLHDVSLRQHVNFMDARNLAIVLAPNLVGSGNPLRDVQICAVAGVPVPNSLLAGSSVPNSSGTTLGTIMKLCIERYFEVFDEVHDRTEAVQPFPDAAETATVTPSGSSPRSLSPDAGERQFRIHDSDDDASDDLVAHGGPVVPAKDEETHRRLSPSSARGVGAAYVPYAPRIRRAAQGGSPTQSSVSGARTSSPESAPRPGSMSRTKSLISLDRDRDRRVGDASRKGSIAVRHGQAERGLGSVRKASGSAVAAMGVTAAGFFSPPPGATRP